MSSSEYLLIIICAVLAIAFVAIFAIMMIRERSANRKDDFILEAVKNKKKKLESNLGGMSFRMFCFLTIFIPVVVGAAIWILLDRPVMAVIIGLASGLVPEAITYFSSNKKQKDFEARYVTALKTLSSSLKSGYSIQQAVSELIADPYIDARIKQGFRQIDSDIKIGISVPDAFFRFAEASGSEDAHDVACAIAMQNEVGGSEARVLEKIMVNIEERLMMRQELKSIFADTTMLVRAMQFLPFMIILLLYFLAPTLIEPFFESVPMIILFFALCLVMILGSFYLNRILKRAKGGSVK